MTEDEMIWWHHQFNGHEFKQTFEDGEGQGSLPYESWTIKKAEHQKLMLLNCGVGKDS